MIFITGDTHGYFERFSNKNFPLNKMLTKSDYVIILGDFGGIWDGSKNDTYWLNWLNKRNFTTLFIDGNHENFNLLNTYEVVEFQGGKVHRIRENVYHLMRGEVYNIDNISIFVMGGANSIDIYDRRINKSWWYEEVPNILELENGFYNLKKCNFKVDIILTHCCDCKTEQNEFSNSYITLNTLELGHYKTNLRKFWEFLSRIDLIVNYKHWYFGHYHENRQINSKKTVLYNDIIRIA